MITNATNIFQTGAVASRLAQSPRLNSADTDRAMSNRSIIGAPMMRNRVIHGIPGRAMARSLGHRGSAIKKAIQRQASVFVGAQSVSGTAPITRTPRAITGTRKAITNQGANKLKTNPETSQAKPNTQQ